ncbi:MAG: hypothetical protein H7Y15_02105 [Pseudonocardia sp.]|nr:hypothetical protein [Pseudonocardia sp.]
MIQSTREAAAPAPSSDAVPTVAPIGHHESHRDLLRRPAPLAVGRLDAIVVPTVRPAGSLREAHRLATAMECDLVLLCSGRSTSAADVIEAVAGDPRVTAVDIQPGDGIDLPDLATSKNVAARQGRAGDTSLKGNIGLSLAALLGWHRMLFLDDDIIVPELKHLPAAAGLLAEHDAVGLSVLGFPDNSVVCHAHRGRGADQRTFIGSGALMVDPRRTPGFFPDVYNADWLFLADSVRLRRVAVTGHVLHGDFDPFAHPSRAYSEEFGDVLAEGIYTLFDQDRAWEHADREFWTAFLDDRRRLIDDVRSAWAAAPVDDPDRDRVLAALAEAGRRLTTVTALMLADYVSEWRDDVMTWSSHLDVLRNGGLEGSGPVQALRRLGLQPLGAQR